MVVASFGRLSFGFSCRDCLARTLAPGCVRLPPVSGLRSSVRHLRLGVRRQIQTGKKLTPEKKLTPLCVNERLPSSD